MTEAREQAAIVEAARIAARDSSRESEKAMAGLREAAEAREFGTTTDNVGPSDSPRADPIASNKDVLIAGYNVWDRRTLIIVHRQAMNVDYLDSEMLRDRFRGAAEQYVPADLRDAVMDWLDRTTD